MKKIAFHTLGCKLNFSETSTLSRMVVERGYQKVDFYQNPDIFIINTCSVTENADKKCHKIVKEAKKISPDAYIIVIGCYAQLKPRYISQIREVDMVLGVSGKFQLPNILANLQKKTTPQILVSPLRKGIHFSDSYSIEERTRAFLKIQDGCDYKCSFCTIPLARGKSRSQNIQNILNNIRKIANSGVREIVLTGVNLGDYGKIYQKRKYHFIELLERLEKVDSIYRFRISSIEPNLLTDEIIRLVSHSKKIVPHFHIPLQSGSDKILKKMRRRYSTQLYAEKIKCIKAYMPNSCIGADVIIGFPDESEKDFLETYRFLDDLELSYLHVFSYSKRENTLAAIMQNQVLHKEKQIRATRLRELSKRKKEIFYKKNIGKYAQVLYEKKETDGIMYGFTENYIKVGVQYNPFLINKIKTVQLVAINSKGHMEIVPS